MKANVNKRIFVRVIAAFLLAVVLALIPPVVYEKTLLNVFYLDDTAQGIAQQFSDATRWIHAGGIAAVWLLNLIFFSVNEKKGDFGDKLQGRTRLQNVLNFLLMILCVAAMIGYRYALSAETWIGVMLPSATNSRLTLWTPYIVVAVCALLLWRYCMRAAPATNCAVHWPIAKAIDNSMKRAERTR